MSRAKLSQKTSEEKAHAEFSASGSSRWLNCPGSIALSKLAPPQRESEYAAEGTEAHACLEFLLKNRPKYEQAGEVALKRWSRDKVEHALAAAEWIEERLSASPGATLLSETKVDASPFTCEGQFGTLDAAVISEFGKLTVIDYKFGAGYAVDPEGDGDGNSQLVYYALALSHQYNHNFSEVELVVIQPRAYHHSGMTTRTFTMDINDLLQWDLRFFKGVDAARRKDAPCASGSWCKWCPAATICPEIKDKAFKAAQIVFADETGVQSVPEPRMIQLPHLGTILTACDRLEDWIAKVREHAVHVLERGGEVQGFKLVAKNSPRRWKDEERISEEARGVFGDKAFTSSKLLSPAQLEKAARGVKGVDKWVAERTTSESSGTTLVAVSDKRPAVTSQSAAEVFADGGALDRDELPVSKPVSVTAVRRK